MKKALIIGIPAVLIIAVAVYFLFFRVSLDDQIVMPYISHQKPRVDPHIPSHIPIADKLDEVLFDGLFNVSANPSGITYEDGLGEFMGIDQNNVVSIRLKPQKKWHSSFHVSMEEDEITISEKEAVLFTAADLKFTLRRIQRLGSLSIDHILVGQAVDDFDFSGPDDNNEIRFQFSQDRIWTESEIKEVLSFKILPHTSEMAADQYLTGSGPYISAGQFEDKIYFQRNPAGMAEISEVQLEPFIDNSTYTTELKNGKINTLLSTPFGAIPPILSDQDDYFYKSSIATTFFAVLFNTQRLSQEQRHELRKLIDNEKILNRFFKVGTEQQRHIADYKGNRDNYQDYLNYSVFPSTSYYVEEDIVIPLKEKGQPNLAMLPDSIRIVTSLNYGSREELSELVEIMNDPAISGGKLKVSAVSNEEIIKGNYDGVLVAVSGYRSTFPFDLYDIFLREPDFSQHRIHLLTDSDGRGSRMVNPNSFQADKNFFRLDLTAPSPERANMLKLLDYVYGFMSTRIVGDKHAYAEFLNELEQEMALGAWLFSLPSMAYFSTQFDSETIDLYGVASQLSTIEKWREKKDE